MALPLGVASPLAPSTTSPWARPPARRPRCGVCASTGRPHHQPGDDNPPSAAQQQPRLVDFAAAFAALTQQAGGGAGRAPRLPSLSDSAEVLQALAEVMQQQVALAQAQATQLVEGTDDYDSYGADDAGGGSRLGGGAGVAKARALAALARDRREVLQEERRARDGARASQRRGEMMLSGAGEGAVGREGPGQAQVQGGHADEEGGQPGGSEAQRGVAGNEEQRQLQVRSALASLRSARQAGDVGDVALWDADVEDSFQRQEAGEAGARMAVHRFVPPPRARASEAPLGALGGLGLLSDEFVTQPPPESEPMGGAVDAQQALPPPPSGVPADVDAILSSALSELGLSMTTTDGSADDRRITVSGEQMAAAVLAWQAREGVEEE